MNLKRLLLVNYCQHARTEIHFHAGLTAIMGPNGAGKSNIVYGILFALTGDSFQDGVKADNIRDISPPGEHAYVELDFSHNGVDFRVVRKLRPTSAKSEFWTGDATQPVLGDNAVNEAVLLSLGVEKAVIQELMIVPQESLFGFLDRTQAKRLESWQRVLRLIVMEHARQAIDRHLKQHPIAVGPSADTLSTAMIGVSEAESLLAKLIEQLAKLPAKEHVQVQLDQLNAQATAYQLFHAAQQRMFGAYNAAVAANQSKESAWAAQQGVEAELAALPQFVDTGAIQTQLQALQQYQAMPALPPEPPAVDFPLLNQPPEIQAIWNETPAQFRRQQVQTLLTDTKAALAEYRRAEQAYAAGVCRTCQQPIPRPQELDGDPVAMLSLIAASEAANAMLLSTAEARTRWEQACQRVHGVRETVHAMLLRCGISMTPEFEAVLPGTIASLSQQASEAAQQNANRQRVSHALTHAKATLTATTTELDRRVQEYNEAVAVKQTQVAPVHEHELTAVKQQLQACLDAETAVNMAQARLTLTQTRLADLRKLSAEADAGAAWHDYAGRLAAWLAPGGLPKLVMADAAQRLAPGINSRLGLAGADFTITISPELEFLAGFHDGRRQPDKRLSQGQKDLLGLTFRLALTEATTEGLNVLVIDEPTADLDPRYRDRVLAVIDHLRESSAGSGLQVVIVTHSKALAERCDKIVDLTPGANA